jgi:hypothetical protein
MPSEVFLNSSYVNISDADLVLTVQLVIECIDLNGYASDSWFTTVRELWWRAIHEGGFGLIDLSLNNLLTDADHARKLVDLLRRSVDRAHCYSPAFPTEWANRLGFASVYFSRPVPVHDVVEHLISLIGLITLETAIERRGE